MESRRRKRRRMITICHGGARWSQTRITVGSSDGKWDPLGEGESMTPRYGFSDVTGFKWVLRVILLIIKKILWRERPKLSSFFPSTRSSDHLLLDCFASRVVNL